MPVRFDLISFICAGTRLPCQSESARAWILNLFHFFLLSSCGFIFISLSPYSTIIFIFGVCFHFILCHNLLVYSSGQVDSDFSFKVQRVHAYNVNEWIKFWISRRCCCCWSGGRKCRAIWRIEGNFSGDSFSLFYSSGALRESHHGPADNHKENGRPITSKYGRWGKIMSNNKEKERKKMVRASSFEETTRIGFSLIFSPWDSCTVYSTRHSTHSTYYRLLFGWWG